MYNRGMPTRIEAPHVQRRAATGLAIFVVLIAAGSVGYMLIERWSFIDALFMTVTTVTTVGYREVQPLDTKGQVFTIGAGGDANEGTNRTAPGPPHPLWLRPRG
jgi:hypothetical protein